MFYFLIKISPLDR